MPDEMRLLSAEELAALASAIARPEPPVPAAPGFYTMPLALRKGDRAWRVIGLVTNGHQPLAELPCQERARQPGWPRYQGMPLYLFPMTIREARALRDRLTATINDMESRLGLYSPDDTTED
ncbi:hypothetical protein [Paraburkholderia sp. SIMBA_030]|uniref:hypothetical protein n=1 Tax=Paraburkholderia sp. SIMBA_030 TaxID=3085773 RepID=UPI00397D094F